MTTLRVPASELLPGDVILPPEREMRLWMRREADAGRLDHSAFRITVARIIDGEPDKRGAWLVVKGADGRGFGWSIRMRPATPWPLALERAR